MVRSADAPIRAEMPARIESRPRDAPPSVAHQNDDHRHGVETRCAGRQQHSDHAGEVEEIEEEARAGVRTTGFMRALTVIAAILVVMALLLIIAAIFVR